MQIRERFSDMIDACSEKMSADELSFLAGYATALINGVARKDSVNYVEAKRFLKIYNSTRDMCESLKEDESFANSDVTGDEGSEHPNITVYHSLHKVGNTTAMLQQYMKYSTQGFKVVYVTDDGRESIVDKVKNLNEKFGIEYCPDNMQIVNCDLLTVSENYFFEIYKTVSEIEGDVVLFIDTIIKDNDSSLDYCELSWPNNVHSVNIVRNYCEYEKLVDLRERVFADVHFRNHTNADVIYVLNEEESNQSEVAYECLFNNGRYLSVELFKKNAYEQNL